ncbi:uncharacterized protein METZ01_LOCUS304033, partial [marine metagenome]
VRLPVDLGHVTFVGLSIFYRTNKSNSNTEGRQNSQPEEN